MSFGPSTRIGVLGGGQLGRMMIQEAVDLDARVEVMDPSAEAPCRYLTHRFVQGDLTDRAAVEAFGAGLDCLTIEIEHVSVAAMAALEAAGVRVVPRPAHVALIQDKGLQKQFFVDHGIPTAPFSLMAPGGDRGARGYPVVQKLRTGGYDGKGVAVLHDATSTHFADAACVLEDKVALAKELSVIVARRGAGDVAARVRPRLARVFLPSATRAPAPRRYAPTECVFDDRGNVVSLIASPADVDAATAARATAVALDVVEKMDFVGVLAVELFLDVNGAILVNEVAPRAHNSGHHTIEANATSQFAQLLRVALDLPLGDVAPVRAHAATLNILGDADAPRGAAPAYRGLAAALATPGVHPHLYGKSTVSPFRKMGHVTVVGDSRAAVRATADHLLATVGVAGVPK